MELGVWFYGSCRGVGRGWRRCRRGSSRNDKAQLQHTPRENRVVEGDLGSLGSAKVVAQIVAVRQQSSDARL
jgi:hypothetical protein